MISIWQPKILLPHLLENDARLNSARSALENALADLSRDSRLCLFLPRLNEIDGELLDVLANQYHVDFYESDMPDDIKRSLITDSVLFHRRKGTPAAIEEVVRKLFAQADIEEWFEYGGEPYHFRLIQNISADDESADRRVINQLRAAVAEAKNTRSWVDYYGFVADMHDDPDAFDSVAFLNPVLFSFDRYDYRRHVFLFDGNTDYGCSPEHYYDGASEVGRATYGDKGNRADYGREQAADLERMDFDIALDIEDEERVELEPLTHIEQEVTYNGRRTFNGTVFYNGTLRVDFNLEEDETTWRLAKEFYQEHFDEPCPECGAKDYDFWKASVRLGEETFFITDKQFGTVRIACRQCGCIIVDFIIPDDSWRVV